MANFMKVFRSVVFLILAIALPIALAGCTSAGSGTSPTLPSQIPIAVEYAGETIAGNIAVETSQTALFTVTDSSGNIVDPALITAELAGPSASLSLAKELLFFDNLGTVEAVGDYIVYTAADYMPPNQLGQVELQVSYEGALIGTNYLNITPYPELINYYKFTDVYTTATEEEFSNVSDPAITTDKFGNVFACFLYEELVDLEDGKGGQRVDTKIALKRGSYSETTGVGIEWQEDKLITAMTNDSANFCSVMVSNTSSSIGSAKIVLMWEHYNGSSTNGSSYLIISNDGGENFTERLTIDFSVYSAALDQDGNIHMAAVDIDGCPDGPALGIKYLSSDGSTVTDNGTVNNEVPCMAGNEHKPQIAVSDDGATAYIVWQDTRDYSSSPLVIDTYLAVVTPEITEMKLRSDTCTQAACFGGYDMFITIDKLGQPIVSWNEFTTDTWPLPSTKSSSPVILMKTHLAILNPQDNQPEYALLATSSEFDLSETLFFSRNSVAADNSNNLHVFFRNQQAVQYVQVRTIDMQVTEAIVPTTTAIGENGYTSAAIDPSGRTYLLFMAGDDSAILTVGTSSPLLQ